MKSNTKNLLFFLCVFIIALIACVTRVKAQDEYGQADFSRRDCFTRDKLVGCWNPLSAKPMGDAFGGQGDFEGTWDTSHATCSACPEGWSPNNDVEEAKKCAEAIVRIMTGETHPIERCSK